MTIPPVSRDADSAAFFDSAAHGDLLVQACGACSTVLTPEAEICWQCGAAEPLPFGASGLGTLISWVVVHSAPMPLLADAVPYASAIVELAEGPWLVTRLVDVPEPYAGMRLQVRFVVPDAGDEALAVFTAASASA